MSNNLCDIFCCTDEKNDYVIDVPPIISQTAVSCQGLFSFLSFLSSSHRHFNGPTLSFTFTQHLFMHLSKDLSYLSNSIYRIHSRGNSSHHLDQQWTSSNVALVL